MKSTRRCLNLVNQPRCWVHLQNTWNNFIYKYKKNSSFIFKKRRKKTVIWFYIQAIWRKTSRLTGLEGNIGNVWSFTKPKFQLHTPPFHNCTTTSIFYHWNRYSTDMKNVSKYEEEKCLVKHSSHPHVILGSPMLQSLLWKPPHQKATKFCK